MFHAGFRMPVAIRARLQLRFAACWGSPSETLSIESFRPEVNEKRDGTKGRF